MSQESISEMPTGQGSSRRIDLAQYDSLKMRLARIDLVLWLALFVGPLWAGAFLAALLATLVVGGPYSITVNPIAAGLSALASILVLPLYRLRRQCQYRIEETKARLEH
jgi:membrane protein YdbS with pleckstrin-like domain